MRWLLPFLAFITALAILRTQRRPSFVECSRSIDRHATRFFNNGETPE